MGVQPGGPQGPEASDTELLTVQFFTEGEPYQKTVYRFSEELTLFGAHTAGELPPSFQPGSPSLWKYASPDLMW